jgi:methylmalonyl-CoA mutase C-terminal domain/subunit
MLSPIDNRPPSRADNMPSSSPLRIVLAKVGLDGHDRGIKVVARALRDAGFHVIYAGLWQTPEAVVRAVADEDADWLGLSLLSGAHMTLVPRVLQLLRDAGLEQVGVLVGGIVPETDVPKLTDMGVARVFGPGTSMDDIVAFLRQRSEAGHA